MGLWKTSAPTAPQGSTEDRKKKQYEAHRERSRKRQRDISAAGRDIGPLPEVVNPERKEACRHDFLKFCLTYFPNIFTKPLSVNQPKFAGIMEDAALNGGQYAFCVERGGAKTTFCELFNVWCIAYGHKKFLIYCGANKQAAEDSFNSVKREFETNSLLAEDFPEICHPIEKLGGKPNRAGGMMLDGKNIGFSWTKDILVFPAVEGSPAAGSVFKAKGIHSRLHGEKEKTRHGENLRPDCVVVDDIQKIQNANNPKTAEHFLTILTESIEGLKSQDTEITILVPGTRMSPHCFMSQITDRKKYPQYRGRIFKAMESLPENLNLWREYYNIWVEETARIWDDNIDDAKAWEKGMVKATEFYRHNRAAMDKGAVVAWPEMYGKNEISGIQKMMNIFLQNENKFWTQYQNEPRDGTGISVKLDADILQTKVKPDIPQGVIPADTTCITLGCDVQQELLYWVVMAWRPGFNGHVVDYGTCPEQNSHSFIGSNPPVPLSKLYPDMNVEPRLEKAVGSLIDDVLHKKWKSETGEEMTIDRGLIDSNWITSTHTIRTVINRRFRHYYKNGRYAGYPLLPSRGTDGSREKYYENKDYVESKTIYSHLFKPKSPQELVGTVVVNTYRTKTFGAHLLIAPVGAPGSVTIHATPRSGHFQLFEHFTSEFAEPASIGDHKFDKWKLKPGLTENHWWDCYILNIVGAAMNGVILDSHDAPKEEIIFHYNPEGVG